MCPNGTKMCETPNLAGTRDQKALSSIPTHARTSEHMQLRPETPVSSTPETHTAGTHLNVFKCELNVTFNSHLTFDISKC